MTAPLIVGELINLTYYFSAVDPWAYGSGSKVIHNMVAGMGVMLGSQSDLQKGLPLQSVNDGVQHYHEPMRLLAIIEAPPDRIRSIIQKHALLQHVFHNQWMNFMACRSRLQRFFTISSRIQRGSQLPSIHDSMMERKSLLNFNVYSVPAANASSLSGESLLPRAFGSIFMGKWAHDRLSHWTP